MGERRPPESGFIPADPVEIDPPRARSELDEISPVLAAAFLDDPVWIAVGPRSRGHRALANRLSFWGSLRAAERLGARIRVARRGPGGPVAGATVAFEPGAWPISDSALAWELPWTILSGPLPAWRGLRTDRLMRERHVEHRHVYLWFLGVDPALHGRGVGRVLIEELHSRSDELGAPTYLETGTEENVRFYEARGYGVRGELTVPGGARMWLMERPAADLRA